MEANSRAATNYVADGSSVLVVCTKDRNEDLDLTLKSISFGNSGPSQIIVVESGQRVVQTKRLLLEYCRNIPVDIYLLESDYGLPHQRNVALSFIQDHLNSCRVSLIHFLDDDLDVDAAYFESCRRAFRDKPLLVALGGQDGNQRYRKSNRLRRVFLGEPYGQGKIGKSGLVSAPHSPDGFSETDWIAGGAMTIRASVLESFRFDGKKRMFGEDVDASI
jgi:hypothetical protein